jgi:hypothetical protein
MQSKNVLWLGLLLVLLLTVFCIAKYINQFHPKIQTITKPTKEIIDQSFELQPVQIADISKEDETQEDAEYLKVIKLIEQEEKDIEDAYNRALIQEKKKSLKLVKVEKPIKKVSKQKKKSFAKQKTPLKKPKKFLIETILANQTLVAFGKLSYLDKQKLKKIVHNFKKHPSSYLRIETKNKNSKFYSARRYLASLGVLQEDIQVLANHRKNAISISHSNNNNIEISLIKKD